MANRARAKHHPFLPPPPTEGSATGQIDGTMKSKEDELPYGRDPAAEHSATQIEQHVLN